MRREQRWLAAVVLLAAAGGSLAGPDPARAVADRIDKHIQTGLDKARVKPAPLSDDAEFLRRVSLQLAGRIPPVSEVRAFLADTAPDKRERLVQELLSGARYVTHFVAVWRSWLMPEADASIQARFLVPTFDSWLRSKLRDNVGYDKLVHELLTTPIDNQRGSPLAIRAGGGPGNPTAFYLGKELKAENLGGATARLFLGIRLECAQCHNHPFAEWKKEQFWSYAAFFSGIRSQRQGDFIAPQGDQPDRKEITIPGTDKVVQARFPDGSKPSWENKEPARKVLADWVTSPKNPYFARATVNRLWDHFFGLGLIDPVDEMAGTEAVASHPELLDELAKSFADSGYDLRFLMRAITYSKTYQRSSAKVEAGKDEVKLFARYPLRGLTAEQIYDSVAMATGHNEAAPNIRGGFGGPRSARQEFVTRFNEQSGKATEFQTSILQALALMNGKLIEDATSLDRSETLMAVVDNPFMTLEERIETLYLSSVSRMPRAKELARMKSFVEGKNQKEALADIFWTLLNGSEFILNH